MLSSHLFSRGHYAAGAQLVKSVGGVKNLYQQRKNDVNKDCLDDSG